MKFPVQEFGLNPPASRVATVGFAIGWLAMMVAYTL
jgi:hypothetical protein